MRKLISNSFIVGLVLLSGCVSTKSVSDDAKHPQTNLLVFNKAVSRVMPKNGMLLFEGNVKNSDKAYAISGKMIFNPEGIYISIASKTFGMEVYRLTLKRDTLILLDKLNKQYSILPTPSIQRFIGFPLTSSNTLALLTGYFYNPVTVTCQPLSDSYVLSRQSDYLLATFYADSVPLSCIATDKTIQGFQSQFLITDNGAISSGSYIYPQKSTKLEAGYQGSFKSGIAKHVTLNGTSFAKPFVISCAYTSYKPFTDSLPSISIPKSYTRFN